MKPVRDMWGDRPLKKLVFVYQGLLVCLVVLGVILVLGTVYGVFFHTGTAKNSQVDSIRNSSEGQTFLGIGQIRIPTADPQPGMVVIFVSFIYYPDDKAFTEEIVLRVKDFRGIIENYFSSYSTVELRKLDDESIKTELLLRFNNILRLGQLDTLYFSDFMIIG